MISSFWLKMNSMKEFIWVNENILKGPKCLLYVRKCERKWECAFISINAYWNYDTNILETNVYFVWSVKSEKFKLFIGKYA